MKKSIIFMIIFIMTLVSLFPVSASAEYYNLQLENDAQNAGSPIKSEAYYLVNIDTGAVIFSHNADKQLQCASLVKIATAILTVENCDNLDTVVTVSESALKPLVNTYSASADLKVGEQITVRNLLYCMMLENANDACNVLAEFIGGTITDFVGMMNTRAKELGCTNTNFVNAHGLDADGAYSTAYDMYLITKKALEYSVLADMSQVVDYIVPATNMSEARELNNWFDMIEEGTRYYYTYARGFKCGMTDAAQRCASFVASKDAYTYVGIILGCPNEDTDGCGYKDNTALFEAKRMLRWAFLNLKMIVLAQPTDTLTSIPVELSTDADYVRLLPEKQLQALLLSSVDKTSLEYVYNIPEKLQAPVEKGQIVGTLQIKYAENVISTVNLVAGDSVSRNSIMHLGSLIKNLVVSPTFLIIVAVIVFGVLLYVMVIYLLHKKKMKADRKRLRAIKEKNLSEFSDLDETNVK